MAAQTSGEQLREHVKVAAERAVLAGVILTGRSSARRAADRSDVEGGHALDLRRGTGWTDEPDEFEDDRGGAAVDEHEDEHDSDGDGDGDDNRHGHGDGDDAETDPFKELRALAETAGATVVGVLLQRRQRPKSATYLGSGKVEELAAMVKMLGASIVIFDNDLSPAQIRTLERTVEVKIIDRSELILDIFANRAATHMAKLQVEIAQLEYTYPRLRAMWDHLGGIVGGAPVGIGTRGPGEQQLEIDRRLVQRRLQHLERQLSEIQERKTREVEQRNLDHFTVGLVGYTNAGKSTLFNRLTEGGAFAHDQLFATLSTRVEGWNLGGGTTALLSDTVGFIRDLPHHLVASFRSTLEETVYASLLLVVLDVAEPGARERHRIVSRTLDEIGATDQPRIVVLNKIDRLEDRTELLLWLRDHPDAVCISAATGEGLDELRERVRSHMIGPVREVEISIPPTDGRVVSYLEQRTEVLDRRYGDDGLATFQVRLGRRQLDELLTRSARLRINGRDPHEAARETWGEQPEPPRLGPPPHKRFWNR